MSLIQEYSSIHYLFIFYLLLYYTARLCQQRGGLQVRNLITKEILQTQPFVLEVTVKDSISVR